MELFLQQRSDGYFYVTVIREDGSCYTEYFFETLLEAVPVWTRLFQVI